MSRLLKSVILGFFTGIVGLGICLTTFGLNLEEAAGLNLLFKLRGVRQPPSDVVIVSIDKESADKLGLPDNTRKWPRSLHARLIEKLVKMGALVIAFDILFEEPQSPEEDSVFAQKIRRRAMLCSVNISKLRRSIRL